MNCAPALDLAGPYTHPFIPDRCYGDRPGGGRAAIGRAVAEGLFGRRVLPVVKHMPGQARARWTATAPPVVAPPPKRRTWTSPHSPLSADLPLATT